MKKILMLCSVILIGILLVSASGKKDDAVRITQNNNTQINEGLIRCFIYGHYCTYIKPDGSACGYIKWWEAGCTSEEPFNHPDYCPWCQNTLHDKRMMCHVPPDPCN